MSNSINFSFVATANVPSITRGRTSQYGSILDAVRSEQFGENGIAIPELTTKQVTGLRLALNKAGLKVATRWDAMNATLYLVPRMASEAGTDMEATPKRSKKA